MTEALRAELEQDRIAAAGVGRRAALEEAAKQRSGHRDLGRDTTWAGQAPVRRPAETE